MDRAAFGEGLTQEILIRLGDRYASMFVRIWQPAGQARGTVYCLHGFTGNGADFDYLAAIGTAEYWGIGPRVGADGYYPVGENWGLTGAVSGAVMWGRRIDRVGVNVTQTNPNEHASETLFNEGSGETVSNVDASLGVSWTPMVNTTFTAGYKIEAWHKLLVNADHESGVPGAVPAPRSEDVIAAID
ncbi:MAG: hypothetical protein E5W57_06505 [Mesorhizobium sp.]|nr:MAG: hypothetical protein E5W57_06505 [Mesorhizobium sp.]